MYMYVYTYIYIYVCVSAICVLLFHSFIFIIPFKTIDAHYLYAGGSVTLRRLAKVPYHNPMAASQSDGRCGRCRRT